MISAFLVSSIEIQQFPIYSIRWPGYSLDTDFLNFIEQTLTLRFT